MKAKLHYVFSIAMFLFCFSVMSQNSPWKKLQTINDSEKISKYQLNKNNITYFELNAISLKKNLGNASKRTAKTKQSNTVLSIPGQDGKLESFHVFEASVFSPELAEKFPDIKSYVGYSLDNPGTRIRMSVSHLGIKTMISYIGKSTVFMEPVVRNSNQYILYSKDSKDHNGDTFECQTIDELNETLYKNTSVSKTTINEGGANNQTLQKFRIAISVTGEYTAYFGGTVADALAGINATLTRVNEMFETDMAVTFELVDAPQLIYTDAVTDPYSDADIGTDEGNAGNSNGWNLQLQNTLTTVIGEAAYDIGHLFGASGGGGNAGCIGCVCVDGSKGSAYTSPANDIPEGDTFDLDFVVHEIGHQMGANHTWSYTNEGSNNVQSEPGSGSTLMAYAGVTSSDDVQLHSDPYFHFQSIKQILDNLSTKTCQTTTVISNNSPIADAGGNYTIPKGTAYVLKGSATDADLDNLTYTWEQFDNGVVNSANFSSGLTTGSINRSLPPSPSPYRYIPTLKSVVNGKLTESNPTIGSAWESISTVTRSLNWALTVRDRSPQSVLQNGQTSYDTMVITVDANAGPFKVTSHNISNLNLTPNTVETITWDVANTNTGSVNVANVNIRLSTDGGQTFPTILAANTPNDGNHNIMVPLMYAPHCRIMVEAVDNIFYAVNDTEFAINYTVNTTCPSTFASASNLNLPISDSQEANHTINVSHSGEISDISISVDISHDYVEDLVITVVHPNGTTASRLWNRNCSSQNNIIMTFKDWTNNINCSSTGSGNTYAPSELLDIFHGLDASGDWKINIKDMAAGDSGTLNSWSLDICTQSNSLTNPNVEEPIVGLNVYPNPNTGHFWVTFNSDTNNLINIALFDIRGRRVFSNDYPNSGGNFREEIKPLGLLSGMYVMAITDGSMSTKQKIIIK